MLDYRLHTFITLCDVMNYRKTASLLNMTQPAVTQHVQYLESVYKHKLFSYEDKVLRKTAFCEQLELYAKGVVFEQGKFMESAVQLEQKPAIRIGATKSIGEYVIAERIKELCMSGEYRVKFDIDNTARLLIMLNAMDIDIALIEGAFDKSRYSYKLMSKEEMVGICKAGHRFGGKQVKVEEVLQEHLIMRERGSGSRAIFEDMIKRHNYSIKSCKEITEISDIGMIKELVQLGLGVSFVYQSAIREADGLSVFRIEEGQMKHEFNYVYLKHTNAENIIKKLAKGGESND